MSKGQALAVELTTINARGQLLAVSAATPDSGLAAGQVQSVSATVLPSTAVDLGPDRLVDGLEMVTIDAAWTGEPPTSWLWSVLQDTTGSAVLVPAGDQCTLIAPAALDGATVVVGVAAYNGATTAQDNVTIRVYPHLEWEYGSSGQWIPVYDDVVV